MLLFIIIILAIATGISITLLVLTRREIGNITKNLKEINTISTNKVLMLSSPNSQLEGLTGEINKLIGQKQQKEVQYKRMDRELRQAIANISHDLRTPLTSIIGYIQLMKDESLSYDERTRYGDIVLRRAKSLNTLLSSFFDLSRLEAGEYGFELQPLNLSNILCELMASFYDDFTGRGIEPDVNIDETVPDVIADDTAVRRVFTNLIQNTLKYGSRFIAVCVKQEGEFLVTSFTNNAPNLIVDDAEHIFERFFTADRTRNGQSTGLGLAITKELVEKMGGTISSGLSGGNLSIIIKWQPYKL